MAILVSGGAGFIGSHVCERLLQKGERVICVDNMHPFYDPRFKRQNLELLSAKGDLVFYNADIRDFSELKSIFKKNNIRKVVHLAALAGIRDSLQRPREYEQVNVQGTLNLLLLSRTNNIDNFIFGSSSSVYGRREVPFCEHEPPGEPLHPYGASKMAAEMLCYAFSKKHNLPITCLRFFSVYGPRGRPDMAPYAFTKDILSNRPITLFGDGSSKRDYTHVLDITEGILKSLQAPLAYETINLGHSREVSLLELISRIERSTKKRARIDRQNGIEQEVIQTRADARKAKELLGWSARMPFSKGISDFVSWFRTERAAL